MKLTIAVLALGTFLSATASAGVAYESWPNIAASPAPVKDEARDGYWWWPQTPTVAGADRSVWGNHGVVYGLGNIVDSMPQQPEPSPKPLRKPQMGESWGAPFSFVYFAIGKSTLDGTGQAATDKVAAYLKHFQKDRLTIEGNTDDTESPTQKYDLAFARANTVKKYIIEQGILAERIDVKSLGDSKPAVPNDCDANRKLNRRVAFDVFIEYDPTGPPHPSGCIR